MLKILQAHLLRAFVTKKIDAIYALYPESFCDKNLAIRKVFAFCDSGADQLVLFFLAGANFWEKHAKNCAIMSMAHITYAIAH